jgi:hypothetical protein
MQFRSTRFESLGTGVTVRWAVGLDAADGTAVPGMAQVAVVIRAPVRCEGRRSGPEVVR